MTEQDKLDLRFCVEQKVDFVAASFVRCAAHVEEVRDVLNRAASDLGTDESHDDKDHLQD